MSEAEAIAGPRSAVATFCPQLPAERQSVVKKAKWNGRKCGMGSEHGKLLSNLIAKSVVTALALCSYHSPRYLSSLGGYFRGSALPRCAPHHPTQAGFTQLARDVCNFLRTMNPYASRFPIADLAGPRQRPFHPIFFRLAATLSTFSSSVHIWTVACIRCYRGALGFSDENRL